MITLWDAVPMLAIQLQLATLVYSVGFTPRPPWSRNDTGHVYWQWRCTKCQRVWSSMFVSEMRMFSKFIAGVCQTHSNKQVEGLRDCRKCVLIRVPTHQSATFPWALWDCNRQTTFCRKFKLRTCQLKWGTKKPGSQSTCSFAISLHRMMILAHVYAGFAAHGKQDSSPFYGVQICNPEHVL